MRRASRFRSSTPLTILDELDRFDDELVGGACDWLDSVKGPLDFAPAPERLARRLFDDADVERHLAALAASQKPDGGWPITWEPPSEASVLEWRGFVTVAALVVLRGYGRLSGTPQTSR